MYLENENIEKIISYRIGKPIEEIFEKDLELIEELTLNNRNFLGECENISLNILKYLPNIKVLSLQYFELEGRDVEIINELKELKAIELISCKQNYKNQINNKSIESLTISNSKINNFDNLYLPKILTLIGVKNINLNNVHRRKNIERLYLQDCVLDNIDFIIDCENLKEINLDGTKVKNVESLNKISKKIDISNLKVYNQNN